MPAPSATNGLERSIKLIAVPSVLVVVGVTLTHQYYGEFEAGLVLIALTALIFSSVASKAKYWNSEYTLFVIIGCVFLVFVLPGVMTQFVAPVFAELDTLLTYAFIGVLGYLFLHKI